MKKYFSIRKQDGFVSILVTLIIMIVLTLIVTGFAQLARNEQRQALDRQLATQALYAAESGINAASAAVRAQIAANDYSNTDDCNAFSLSSGSLGSNNAKPTCILIKKNPNELLVQNVQTNKSTILPIIKASSDGTPQPISSLTISWQNVSGPNDIRAFSTPFPSATSWGSNNVGVLRIDLVPTNSLNSDYLRNNMFTAFLVPTLNSTAVSFLDAKGVAKQGKIFNAHCPVSFTSKKRCSFQINCLDNACNGLGANEYYLRMKSLYSPSDVVVCPSIGFNCDPNSTLIKAQTVIDVTAKAEDVLKRVQVRINTDPNSSGSNAIPEYTLDSAESICKILTVTPGSTTEPACP